MAPSYDVRHASTSISPQLHSKSSEPSLHRLSFRHHPLIVGTKPFQTVETLGLRFVLRSALARAFRRLVPSRLLLPLTRMPPSRLRNGYHLDPIEEERSDEVDLIPDSLPTHDAVTQQSHHASPSAVDLNRDTRVGALTPSTARVIAVNSTSRSGVISEPASSNTLINSMFIRPVSAGDDPASRFRFVAAPKVQLNFTGNRKVPIEQQSDGLTSHPIPVETGSSSTTNGELRYSAINPIPHC